MLVLSCTLAVSFGHIVNGICLEYLHFKMRKPGFALSNFTYSDFCKLNVRIFSIHTRVFPNGSERVVLLRQCFALDVQGNSLHSSTLAQDVALMSVFLLALQLIPPFFSAALSAKVQTHTPPPASHRHACQCMFLHTHTQTHTSLLISPIEFQEQWELILWLGPPKQSTHTHSHTH